MSSLRARKYSIYPASPGAGGRTYSTVRSASRAAKAAARRDWEDVCVHETGNSSKVKACYYYHPDDTTRAVKTFPKLRRSRR